MYYVTNKSSYSTIYDYKRYVYNPAVVVQIL